MIDSQRKLTELGEGRRAKKYKDSLGYWTIGVGHLIDPRKGGKLPPHIERELKARGIDIWKDQAMPEDLIDKLFDYDLAIHAAELEHLLPWVKWLDPVRQAVMGDMCFNLGFEPFDGDGFKDWPLFIHQMRMGYWSKAAANMRSTLWAKQVGQRAERLAQMVETGEWPK